MFSKFFTSINGLVKRFSVFLRSTGYAVLYFLLYVPCGGRKVFRKKCVDFAGITSGDRLLDICCGSGQFSSDIITNVPGVELVGIDISEEAIQNACQNKHLKTATFITGSAARLPFEKQRFDKCVISFGLHHLSPRERHKALTEMRRVLVSGGCLVVIDYNSPEKGIKRLIASIFAFTDQSREAYRMFVEKSLPSELEQAGFEIQGKNTACAGVIQMVKAVGEN